MNKFTLFAAIGLVACQSVQGQDVSVARVASTTGVFGTKHLVAATVNNSQLQRNGGLAAINVAYTDDFEGDNTEAGLIARGYTSIFNGTGPVGTTATWFQGNVASFAAYNGSDTSYVAANYNTVASGDIDNWLITPPANVATGDILSFYSKATPASTFPDSIRVMYSATGAVTAADPSWVELGRFKVNTANTWVLSTYAAPAAGATATFAIRYNVVDGGPLGTNSDYIGIDQLDIFTPAAVDGGVVSIDGLADGCGLSATTPISITIVNNGGAALTSAPVSYTINSGTPVNETFTGNIAPFGTATYTFTATADLSAIGAYAITATTSIPSDANAANDASSVTVNNNAPTAVTTGTPFTEGFESVAVGAVPPTGWVTEDTDGDGANWDFSATLFNTGLMCARIGFAGAAVANAENWLITPCLDLLAGTNYQLNYFFKSFDATATSYEIEARYGTAAVGSSMTNSIAVETLFPDDLYHLASHTFTVPSSGSYNVGFNGFGAAPQVSLRIDDVEITVITGINNVTLQDAVKIAPNPTNGIVYVTSKANENVTVAVYNNMGQEVASYNFNQAFKTQIDLSAFANGIYTIRLNSANESLVSKVVLNK